MTVPAARDRDPDRALVTAIHDRAQEQVEDWFPELNGSTLHTSLLRTSKRPRSAIYVLALSDGRRHREVVVKVRRHDAAERNVDRYEGIRPVLTPERVLPATETGRREYEGLRLIETLFREADPAQHGVVRALAWLPEHSALVMDHIGDPTLKAVLLRQSRLWWPEAGHDDLRPWHNAGRWLRTYHRAQPGDLDERLPDRDAAVTLLDSYVDFLIETGHDCAAIRSVAAAAGDRLTADLPARLPLVLGHGDYVAQNLFAGRGGRVTGFDPMPLWRVPPYEDIARFTVGVRLVSQRHPAGAIGLDRARLDAYEQAFLTGYFDTDPVPHGAVHAFQTLLLLDRWGAVVSKQRRRARATHRMMHQLRVQSASRFFRREAMRLTAVLRASAAV